MVRLMKENAIFQVSKRGGKEKVKERQFEV